MQKNFLQKNLTTKIIMIVWSVIWKPDVTECEVKVDAKTSLNLKTVEVINFPIELLPSENDEVLLHSISRYGEALTSIARTEKVEFSFQNPKEN